MSLYLPRSIRSAPARVMPPSEVPLGDGELVLVVEDNEQVREVTLKRIKSLGYAVAEARTGPEAIERLQSVRSHSARAERHRHAGRHDGLRRCCAGWVK